MSRKAQHSLTPVYFPVLGLFPRGWLGFANLLGHLTCTDTLSFSCEADRAIYHNMVQRGVAQESILPFFADTEIFIPFGEKKRTDLRKAFGIRPGVVLFLYTGRITSEKNIQDLIWLFSAVVRENPKAQLLIVGKIADVKFMEFGTGPNDLEDFFNQILLSAPHLRSKIRFHPAVEHDNLVDIYNLADIFINLTLHHDENFGLSQVEAMSCGLPVIGSDWGGLKDTVKHGETGLLIPTYVTRWGVRLDRPNAVESMLLLSRSPKMRRQMGAKARLRVLRKFSIPVFEKNLTHQIQMALEGRGEKDGKNKLSSFGKEYYAEFGFKRRPYGKATYQLYENLITPYATRRAREGFESNAPLFVPGHFALSANLTFELISPLWPLRLKISQQEKKILTYFRKEKFMTFRQLEKKVGQKFNLEKVLKALVNRGVLVVGQ
jgi:glycosyltransferase involved in cell wall biosynthesis